MLSSGYAHKHNNEEGEPVTKERYILWLMVSIFTLTLGTLIRVLLVLEELDRTQVLCKHICGVLITVYEENMSILPGDNFSNIMIPDVNMFGASLGDRVGCDED